MTGGREIVQVGMSSVVPPLQPALSGVRQDLRPDALGFTRNGRVHTFYDLVQAEGGVNAAHDHGHPSTAEVSGHLIGAVRL